MAKQNLFYYPYASFTIIQLTLLKVTVYFNNLVLLDPVGTSWDIVGANHHVREAVNLFNDARILEIVTPASVLVQYEPRWPQFFFST